MPLNANRRSRADLDTTTLLPYPYDRGLIELLRTQALATPDAIAVEFDDTSLTYGELDERANRLGSYLRARGVGPEIPVAIFLERSLDMIVAVLGVQRAGGAYVPIDPLFPGERIAFMLADSGAGAIVTSDVLRHRLPPDAGRVVSLDAERTAIAAGPAEPPPIVAGPTQLAYIIYTSGSTGRPKGVGIEHGNVLNCLRGTTDAITVRPGDVLVSVAPLVFDIASSDIHVALMSGARLVVASRETSVNPNALMALIERTRATHVQATPPTWRMLTDAGWSGRRGLTALSTGEALPMPLATLLLERADAVWNLYGPTETTTYATTAQIQPGKAVTIGRAMRNVTTYVLDARLRPLSDGDRGELYIGGSGVTRGYINRPELTAERFLPDPFSDVPGARMYRTGDLARFLHDGNIEYLGRADFQVKIRGYRIEPGEIETVLEERSDIRSAVVLAKENPAGEKALVAYVTVAPGAALSPTAVRRDLANRLPDYMVPEAIFTLDALPINVNGKIDRGELAAAPFPAHDRRSADGTCIAPGTPLEEHLTAIWEEVLGVRPIGITDDFFEIGASSITAARLFERIARELGTKLPLSPLFEAPTIQRLAALIERNGDCAQAATSVVPMQTQASGTPLFCVHGGAGHVLHFMPLAKRLGVAHPFYGIQMKGLYGDAKPDVSVEEMARTYVREVQAVQPTGPYMLSGYCFGAIVALEMASQLQRRGESVALLATFNGPTPAYLRRQSAGDRAGSSARQLLGRTRRRVADLRDRRRLALGLHVSGPRRRQAFREICERALRRYTPPAYCGPMLVVAGKGLFAQPTLGWDAVARDVDVVEVPGTHRYTLDAMREPYVDFVAARLDDAMRRAAPNARDGQHSGSPKNHIEAAAGSPT